ncbi:MAG: alpha-E domain-containing protein, partial [Nitrospirota bacterium]|nr:alpha-E domain-containing protein [Nitrospirota bacterium]
MLSRTAESFFWIGRYIERAEYTARFVNVHYHLLTEIATGED